jgi:hypothetical protein
MHIISNTSIPLKVCKTVALRYELNNAKEIKAMRDAFNAKETTTRVEPKTFEKIESALATLFNTDNDYISVRQYIDDEAQEPLTRYLFRIMWAAPNPSAPRIATVIMTKYIYSAS